MVTHRTLRALGSVVRLPASPRALYSLCSQTSPSPAFFKACPALECDTCSPSSTMSYIISLTFSCPLY